MTGRHQRLAELKRLDYRRLAGFFRRDVILRHRVQCEASIRGAHMTINAARYELNAMQDIADILDWLADEESEIAGRCMPGSSVFGDGDGYGGDG